MRAACCFFSPLPAPKARNQKDIIITTTRRSCLIIFLFYTSPLQLRKRPRHPLFSASMILLCCICSDSENGVQKTRRKCKFNSIDPHFPSRRPSFPALTSLFYPTQCNYEQPDLVPLKKNEWTARLFVRVWVYDPVIVETELLANIFCLWWSRLQMNASMPPCHALRIIRVAVLF